MVTPTESPPHSDSEETPPERKGKSVIFMKELIALRNSGTKLEVKFDHNGEAIGKNGDKYKSYIGVLARTKVPIDISRWKEVKLDLKEKIWDDVLTIFNIPLSKKKQVISIANSRWTNFKSTLTSLYVYKKKLKKKKLPVDDDPLKKYPYIRPDVWTRFKQSRMTNEFRASSMIAAERQKHNIYPHRMSRAGYCKTKQKMEAKLRASKKHSDDPDSTITIDRGDLWIEGRINKDGDYLNPETKEAVEKIHSLKEEVSQGNFTPTGKNDILTKALGTDEHYGRVRGVGGGVGHKMYFGKFTHRRSYGMHGDDFDKLTQMITERVRADTLKEMEAYFDQRGVRGLEKMNTDKSLTFDEDVDQVNMDRESVKASFQDEEPDPFSEISEKGVECRLAVVDLKLRYVALGRVFRAPTTTSRSHGHAFGENELRVSIEVILEGEEEALLPVPTEDFSTVGDALGSFVRWPKHLITLKNSKQVESENSNKDRIVNSRKKVENEKLKNVESDKAMPKESITNVDKALIIAVDTYVGSRKLLAKVANMMDNGHPYRLTLSKHIIGYDQILFINKDDISQLLDMEELNISCLQTFIGFLCGICDNNKYRFLCTQFISMIGHAPDQASKYVSDFMLKGQKPFYLAPYYEGRHWMLAVIDIVEHNNVYWFDPLGNSVPTRLQTLLNTSPRVYSYEGGTRKGSQVPKWIQVNCPLQPGIVECGYYVMRYMLEIVARLDQTTSIYKHFNDTRPYSPEEIDEVRDIWANYFLNN